MRIGTKQQATVACRGVGMAHSWRYNKRTVHGGRCRSPMETGVLKGRVTGAMRSGGEGARKERRAAAGAMNDSHRICAFSRRTTCGWGIAHLWTRMGFCNYVHTARFGTNDNEEGREIEWRCGHGPLSKLDGGHGCDPSWSASGGVGFQLSRSWSGGMGMGPSRSWGEGVNLAPS